MTTLRPSMQPRETRSEALARWERMGWLRLDCKQCRDDFYNTPEYPWAVFAPTHEIKDRCQSPRPEPHCSCPVCWG
jgi:hypothetical protein